MGPAVLQLLSLSLSLSCSWELSCDIPPFPEPKLPLGKRIESPLLQKPPHSSLHIPPPTLTFLPSPTQPPPCSTLLKPHYPPAPPPLTLQLPLFCSTQFILSSLCFASSYTSSIVPLISHPPTSTPLLPQQLSYHLNHTGPFPPPAPPTRPSSILHRATPSPLSLIFPFYSRSIYNSLSFVLHRSLQTVPSTPPIPLRTPTLPRSSPTRPPHPPSSPPYHLAHHPPASPSPPLPFRPSPHPITLFFPLAFPIPPLPTPLPLFRFDNST